MEDTIVSSHSKSSTSSLNPSRIICHVCQQQFSHYTCPRCNLRYCSLKCYKSHSLCCTESFMQENVVRELQQMQPDEQTKHKMLDILKRFHSEEEMDSVDEDFSADSTLSEEIMEKVLSVRQVDADFSLEEKSNSVPFSIIFSCSSYYLGKVDFSTLSAGHEVNFDDLTVEGKKRFHRAIAYGELSKMIKPWDPWWSKPSARKIRLSKEGTQLVQPLPEQRLLDDIGSNESSDIPLGPENPPLPVSRLSSKQPSTLLTVHLVDILYSYCFTLRLYNGDWRSDALGSVMVVLSVSSVLGQGRQPETVLETLSLCLEQLCSPAYRHLGGLQFGLAIIDDVIGLLVLGSSALVCALCDMHRLIQAGEKEAKSDKPRKLRGDEIRNTIKLAERKIYFIMCWVHEQREEAWSSLAAVVRAEKASAMEFQWSNEAGKLNNQAESKDKSLIEEI